MSGPTNTTTVMEEKEAPQHMHVEDVADDQGFDPAELEPKMNLQTILAFLVSIELMFGVTVMEED